MKGAIYLLTLLFAVATAATSTPSITTNVARNIQKQQVFRGTFSESRRLGVGTLGTKFVTGLTKTGGFLKSIPGSLSKIMQRLPGKIRNLINRIMEGIKNLFTKNKKSFDATQEALLPNAIN